MNLESIKKQLEDNPRLGWGIFFFCMITVFLLGLLAANIMERRSEALIAYAPLKKIKPLEPRNEKWGEAYPNEFQTYLKTAEGEFKSKYNGNNLKDMLAEDTNLVILWAGYGFAKDYKAPRGHFHAIEDIRNTLRTGGPKTKEDGPQPSTCWSCKSPDVPRMIAKVGTEEFYKGKWGKFGDQIVNPIGCGDCHDSETMDLKITRPALAEVFNRQGKDVNKATHQEKRSLVCAQCHVEYYFKGSDTYLTFPWDKGMSVEDIEKYYDEVNFTDWTHKLSKAPMLKAQHPDYEVYKMGIHAKRGVSCADCHMPYVTVGGVKHSDHQAQSPLNNINKSCQVCHRESEEELKQNVYSNQDKIFELKMIAEDTLVKAHIDAKTAWDNGATEKEMQEILKLIRHAQWRWDFAVASHGASAHAPTEIARILGTSIQKSGEARRLLSEFLTIKNVKTKYPDISTKEKAQEYIGLDIKALEKEKAEFKETILPEWDKKAKIRNDCYDKSSNINDCE